MVINKVHKLSSSELELLKRLIGKKLISIDASRHLDNLDGNTINCLEEIYLSFEDFSGHIKLIAEFDETDFGDDFITLQLVRTKSIECEEQIGEHLPSLSYKVEQDFIITKIEVYGDSYQVYSENNKENPYWDIERQHPNQPIQENIENENVFVFYAENQQMLVRGYDAFTIIEFTFDQTLIQSSLFEKNLEGELTTKLKHSIN